MLGCTRFSSADKRSRLPQHKVHPSRRCPSKYIFPFIASLPHFGNCSNPKSLSKAHSSSYVNISMPTPSDFASAAVVGLPNANSSKEAAIVSPSYNDAPLDLLVIGGGPVGLSTALGAIHRGAKRVLVVEQARTLTKAGQFIDLFPNALHACHLLHPEIMAKLEPFTYSPEEGGAKFGVVNVDGEPLKSQYGASNVKTVKLKWWKLQEVLISLLPRRDMFLLNHHLVDVTHEDEHTACASFIVNRHLQNDYRNWEGDNAAQKSDQMGSSVSHSVGLQTCETDVDTWRVAGAQVVKIRAKVVIGADGINSTVRRCIYRDVRPGWELFAKPVYTGLLRMFAKGFSNIEMRDEKFIRETYVRKCAICRVIRREEDMGPEAVHAVLNAACDAAEGAGEDRVYWTCGFYVPFDEDALKRSSKKEVIDMALQRVQKDGFPEEMIRLSRSLWEKTDTEKQWLRPLYVIPACEPKAFEEMKTTTGRKYPEGFYRPWWHKRTVLVGDALHASPPFLSQGVAMGMEDGYEVVARLGKSGVWRCKDGEGVSEDVLRDKFEGFRKARFERLCYMQKHTMNRCSEYNGEEIGKEMNALWHFEPSIQE